MIFSVSEGLLASFVFLKNLFVLFIVRKFNEHTGPISYHLSIIENSVSTVKRNYFLFLYAVTDLLLNHHGVLWTFSVREMCLCHSEILHSPHLSLEFDEDMLVGCMMAVTGRNEFQGKKG